MKRINILLVLSLLVFYLLVYGYFEKSYFGYSSPIRCDLPSGTSLVPTTETYEIGATTLAQAVSRAQVREHVPDIQEDGSAVTIVDPQYHKITYDPATGKSTCVNMIVKIKTIYPYWGQQDQMCPEVRNKWTGIVADLLRHEERHIRDAKQIWKNAHVELIDKTRSQVEDKIIELVNKYDSASTITHQRHGHGIVPNLDVTCRCNEHQEMLNDRCVPKCTGGVRDVFTLECKCPFGTQLQNGVCTLFTRQLCLPGQNQCMSRGFLQCTNLLIDRNNCGQCGNECEDYKRCINGICEMPTCPQGLYPNRLGTCLGCEQRSCSEYGPGAWGCGPNGYHVDRNVCCRTDSVCSEVYGGNFRTHCCDPAITDNNNPNSCDFHGDASRVCG